MSMHLFLFVFYTQNYNNFISLHNRSREKIIIVSLTGTVFKLSSCFIYFAQEK